jgi:hydrogenase maturation protease
VATARARAAGEVPPADVVVIGIGNPFRRDDGIGPAVVEAVARIAPAGVRVVELDGEPTRVIEAWQGAPLAVVVDAVRSGAAPGTVHRLVAGIDTLPAGANRSSSHALGIGDALDLGRALGRLPDHLVVYGVEAESFDVGPGLSPAVAAVVGQLVDRVLAEVTP